MRQRTWRQLRGVLASRYSFLGFGASSRGVAEAFCMLGFFRYSSAEAGVEKGCKFAESRGLGSGAKAKPKPT